MSRPTIYNALNRARMARTEPVVDESATVIADTWATARDPAAPTRHHRFLP